MDRAAAISGQKPTGSITASCWDERRNAKRLAITHDDRTWRSQ
jgi:hypothetical protein